MMKRQNGFSLVELMISMTLGLFIVGMVLAAYLSGASSRRALSETSLIIENGRYASSVLNDEIQMAGSFGSLDHSNSSLASAPATCTISATNLQNWMNVPIYGFHDIGATGGDATSVLNGCLAAGENIKTGTDVLILRRTATEPTAAGSLTASAYYLQTTSTDSTLATGSGAFNLKKKDGVTAADVWHFEQMIFYVSGVDDQLKRIRIVDGNFSTEAVADNIDAFELEFGIDSNNDGTANSFVTEPATLADWQDVVSVRGDFIVRSETATSSYTDARIYTVADETLPAFNDNFKREAFFVNAQATNISLRRF